LLINSEPSRIPANTLHATIGAKHSKAIMMSFMKGVSGVSKYVRRSIY